MVIGDTVIKNSNGEIFYGLHMCPGVAEYKEPGQEAFRIFLNEDTIRSMNPTFAGRPMFVRHVEEVTPDLDKLRSEADGWVIESFYNAADGKTWAKFVIVSEKGLEAIKRGYKLSNAYIPKAFGQGGLWNGVQYSKEITAGEYEHLAIVPNPRYEESIILTPEKFKSYNEDKVLELKKLSNEKGAPKMKLNFFKKAKVENSADLETMSVTLPKSGKEVSLMTLVNEADDKAEKEKDGKPMADAAHHVMVGEHKMNVKELANKYCEAMNELADMKKAKEENATKAESESEVKEEPAKVEVEGDKKNKEDMPKAIEPKDKEAEPKKNDEAEGEKLKNARENFNKVKNAEAIANREEVAPLDLSEDKVARGKVRYGSVA